MREFNLHNLPDGQFEELVVHVCRGLLGIGTVQFSKGRDGGRDGRFHGTANKFPSEKSPWTGKFIIQSKHSSDPTASCSDADFHVNETSVISKEVPRIKALRESGEVDHYLIVTNRKVSGGADKVIRERIIKETGVANCELIGLETLAGHLMYAPDIVRAFHLDHLTGPIYFHAQDLASVISLFSNAFRDGATTPALDLSYIDIDSKNVKNDLSQRMFIFIRERSSPYFGQINDFLKDPINETSRLQYLNICAELNSKVLTHRDNFRSFDEVFTQTYDAVLASTPALVPHSRLLLVFLHYMYWICELGEK